MKTEVGRLALRIEGDWWVAYYAQTDTMEGALELGRIYTALVLDNRRKSKFMDLMKEAVSFLIRDATGATPTWNKPELAPERERSGSA